MLQMADQKCGNTPPGKLFIHNLFDKEIIRYGIAGIAVTTINIGIYYFLLWAGIGYMTANAVGLTLGKTAAYMLNKKWVYRSITKKAKETLRELFRYIFARGFTGLMDFCGVIVCAEGLGLDEKISKWIMMSIVIVLNFVMGKKIVFRRSFEIPKPDRHTEK